MSNYIITTDSTADLSLEYLRENEVRYLALNFVIDDKEYSYKDNISLQEYYKKMREGKKTSTMQANINEIYEVFEEIIKSGKDILHISFSSQLSGTYNTEKIVANELLEKYPNARIEIIDSFAASGGQGLLVRKAVEKKKIGYDIDDNISYINEIIPRLTHYFTVEDMIYLYRGGRVSKGKAIIANAINIKPILNCNDEGKLMPVDKQRGRKKSIKGIAKLMGENLSDNYLEENPYVVICDADAKEDARELADIIREKYKIKDIIFNEIGPTIGAHSGPGTIALFYIGKHR